MQIIPRKYDGFTAIRFAVQLEQENRPLVPPPGPVLGPFATVVLHPRPAVAAAPNPDDGLDLLLVALLEVAPRDAEVRAICAQAIDRIGSGDGSEPSVVLGRRLLERALITTSRKDTP